MSLQSQLNTQRGQILAANSSAQEAKASSFNPKSSNKETPTSNDRRGQTINAVDSQLQPPPQFNYTTEGTYKGETVRFALQGQVLNKEEKDRVGDTNLILFGGGQGGQCTGLRLYKKTDGARNGVWIGAGTIDGELPSDFDPIDGKFIASSGSGFVYAVITIDTILGTVKDVNIESGLYVPNSNDNITYFQIGFYRHNVDSVDLTNYGCGSILVNVCRNWFVSRPPYYKVFVQFSG